MRLFTKDQIDRPGFEARYAKRHGGITTAELVNARKGNSYSLADKDLQKDVNREWNNWQVKLLDGPAPYIGCIKKPGAPADEWPVI